MKIGLDKYDIAMVNAVTTEPTKPMLHNICLRDGKLAAADGYMLIVREANILEGKQDGEILLPASILKTIKTLPKRQAELTYDDGSLSVSYKDEKGEPIKYDPSLHFKPHIESKVYPKYPQLFPKETAKKAHIAINIRLLKKLVSCLPDNGVLRMGIIDETSPLEFECGSLDRPIRGMLMPMMIDWKEFNWHREQEAKTSEPVVQAPSPSVREQKEH